MIPAHVQAEVLRLFHAEKWRLNTIATQLGLHHTTVRRILEQQGVIPENLGGRVSKIDPYLPMIRETLAKYPRLTASRLYHMARQRGYVGNESHFRGYVARHRPRQQPEAFLRVRTLPGEQAQVDWAHFGVCEVDGAKRRLMAFVMTLSWSRRLFVRFFWGDGMANFLRGHVEGFAFFEGVPRVVLYDNLKSAVVERTGEAIRLNATMLALAAHYRFEPRPVGVRRANEKGRVERAIQYVRTGFFAARPYDGLDDLNAQALAWCLGQASERPCPGERALTVAAAYEREREALIALPDAPYPTEERLPVVVGKTPYIRFDLNDYTVPHTHVGRTLTLVASERVVRVLDGVTTVAEHNRRWGKGAQVEDAGHVDALVEAKRAARKDRGMDRLHHAVPGAGAFLKEIAGRGGNVGSMVSGLLNLLDRYGARELDVAVKEAAKGGAYHLGAVRLVLDRRRDARGLPPPLPVALPADPRVHELVVVPHDLARYDALGMLPEDEA